MNKELMEALDILEKEKEISKETMLEAIENSLINACKNHFGKADNIKVNIKCQTDQRDLSPFKYHLSLIFQFDRNRLSVITG